MRVHGKLRLSYEMLNSSRENNAKFFARNRACEIWMADVILLNLHTFFAFVVSRTDFYSLAKRNFFSRNLIYLYCACTILFRAKCFALFPREKALVESGLIVDFKSLFNAWFPSSLRTCQLRFQVRKLGANIAT
jgi:hypothetical protein